MKNLVKNVTGAALILALPALSFAETKSIYGADNRLDFFEAPASMQTLSNSVVSLWKSARLTEQGDAYKLSTMTLGDAKGLCPGEKFREQNIGAFCSGSLVGEDMVMTAGHCVKDDAGCADVRFVFGHKVTKAGKAGVSTVAKGEVYKCAKIISRKLEEGKLGSDYALLKLDRKVTGHKPLAINRSGSIKKDTKIFVIGHPSGLPLKVAAEAKVRDAGKPEYFVADLDTFGGNSGSAVFNLATSKIEGILVRGDEDYHASPAGCNVVTTFSQAGGRGEDVTKISQLSAFIPMLAGEKPQWVNVNPYTFNQYQTMPQDHTYVAPPHIPLNPFQQ